jgi:CheY-like chemotaxis protein
MAGRALKILVVEDEGLVAMLLEAALLDFGYNVVGPASSTKKALKLLAAEAVDAAVLDVNLGDERVDAVAEALNAASIPFIFASGYSDSSVLPNAFRDRVMLSKPYRVEQVLDALFQLLKPTEEHKTLSAGSVMTQ